MVLEFPTPDELQAKLIQTLEPELEAFRQKIVDAMMTSANIGASAIYVDLDNIRHAYVMLPRIEEELKTKGWLCKVIQSGRRNESCLSIIRETSSGNAEKGETLWRNDAQIRTSSQ